uniref:Mediator of rna polymerase ii transcription subunit 4 n=1 Tax=Triatoma infestans TaxID=30076 RepID=A0A170ZJT6_TRIIF
MLSVASLDLNNH